jgi:hypothetical protein
MQISVVDLTVVGQVAWAFPQQPAFPFFLVIGRPD